MTNLSDKQASKKNGVRGGGGGGVFEPPNTPSLRTRLAQQFPGGGGALTYNGSIGIYAALKTPFSRLASRSKAYLFH